MIQNLDSYAKSFDSAQSIFGGELDETDRSQLVIVGDQQQALDFLQDSKPNTAEFYPVQIDSDLLRAQPALFVGRALLMHNARLDALSPIIITADPYTVGQFQISMFDLPYDPLVGFSNGMHWAVSMKSQTRTTGFGGHGAVASGLEQGHFGAAILGAANQRVANDIMTHGDMGTHNALERDNGIAESLGKDQLLPVVPRTRQLPIDRPFMLQAYWHDKIQNDSGPLNGDFPEATRLMLGAGLAAIGETALTKVERLVKDAVAGAV